jgi:hypothetical protein
MMESGSGEQVQVNKVKEIFDKSIVFIFSFLLKNISPPKSNRTVRKRPETAVVIRTDGLR